MTDTEQTPSIFRSATPAGEKPEPKKNGRRKPKQAASPRDEVKRTRATGKTRKPRAASIPIAVLPALAGMSEADASLLMRLVEQFNAVPKRSRVRIVVVFGKVLK